MNTNEINETIVRDAINAYFKEKNIALTTEGTVKLMKRIVAAYKPAKIKNGAIDIAKFVGHNDLTPQMSCIFADTKNNVVVATNAVYLVAMKSMYQDTLTRYSGGTILEERDGGKLIPIMDGWRNKKELASFCQSVADAKEQRVPWRFPKYESVLRVGSEPEVVIDTKRILEDIDGITTREIKQSEKRNSLQDHSIWMCDMLGSGRGWSLSRMFIDMVSYFDKALIYDYTMVLTKETECGIDYGAAMSVMTNVETFEDLNVNVYKTNIRI